MKKIYLSSSAFAWGRLVFTDSKAGCVRSILLQNHGVKEARIDPKHIVRGALHEKLHEEQLKAAGTPYQREHAVRATAPGYPGVELSGRVDFIRNHAGRDVVEELKSTESKSVISSVINAGKPKITHLAQCVAYMLQLKLDTGYLIYGAYKNLNSESAEVKESDYEKIKERAFEILIDDQGRICVDMEPSGYTVGDLHNHQKLVAEHLVNDTVGERPDGANAAFGSPCTYCVWKPACDAYDNGGIERTTDSFVSYATPLSKGEKV